MTVDNSPHLMILERLEYLGHAVNRLEGIAKRIEDGSSLTVSAQENEPKQLSSLHDVLCTTPIELNRYAERIHDALTRIEDLLYTPVN